MQVIEYGQFCREKGNRKNDGKRQKRVEKRVFRVADFQLPPAPPPRTQPGDEGALAHPRLDRRLIGRGLAPDQRPSWLK